MKSFFVKEPHSTPTLLITPRPTIKENTIHIDKLGVVYSCLFFCEFLLVGVGTHSIFFPNTEVKCFLMHGNKSPRQVVVKLSQWGQNSSAVCAANNAVCGKDLVHRICQKLKKKFHILTR